MKATLRDSYRLSLFPPYEAQLAYIDSTEDTAVFSLKQRIPFLI